MDRVVDPGAGWPGIIVALAAAHSGDTVRLTAGVYAGAETLTVPSGVQLIGDDGAILRFEGAEVAIAIEDAENVVIAGLEIDAYAGLPEVPAEGEPEEVQTLGVIWVVRSRSVEIRDCRIRGAVRRRSSISAAGCRSVRIAGNQTRGTRRGIALWSSNGTIEANDCADHLHGIVLTRDPERLDEPSAAAIRSNRSHENTYYGIYVVSSISEAIEANDCWGNNVGIGLWRNPESPDAPSLAAIRSNVCRDNTEFGIVLGSAISEAIEDNDCWGNGLSGISLQRAPRTLDAPSVATIRSNRCHENKDCGIVLFASSSEAIEANDCWGNGADGICLARDPRSLDAPSVAAIRSNRCHENKKSGIVLISSTSAAIEVNDCWGNGLQGINLARDDWTPDVPSTAPIRSNRCHGNAQCGILLDSSASEAIEANDCWGNDTGICLQRDTRGLGVPAAAAIRSNRCHENAHSGIVLASSTSEAIETNDCWGNGVYGICLARDPRTPATPSAATIRSNRCHENKGSGIVLLSSTSAAIEANDCWGNGVDGICLSRNPHSLDAPSVAAIRSNRCHENTQSGIVLFSSTSEAIEENDCWGNTVDGICLTRDSRSLDAPSVATIASNWCHDNKSSGIAVLSSSSDAIEANHCWSNGADGISLARRAESPNAASAARIRWNLCHENTQCGIVLSASISEAIEANECWGNDVGISLRAPESLDALPTAAIRSNRCRENAHSGIILVSSVDETIEANYCWSNGQFGILLLRDPKNPDAASAAVARSNRLWANRQDIFEMQVEFDQLVHVFESLKRVAESLKPSPTAPGSTAGT